jgi:hypothetical protein
LGDIVQKISCGQKMGNITQEKSEQLVWPDVGDIIKKISCGKKTGNVTQEKSEQLVWPDSRKCNS